MISFIAVASQMICFPDRTRTCSLKHVLIFCLYNRTWNDVTEDEHSLDAFTSNLKFVLGFSLANDASGYSNKLRVLGVNLYQHLSVRFFTVTVI